MKPWFKILSMLVLIIVLALMLSIMGGGAMPAYAASTWQNVGSPGFSAGEASHISLAFDGSSVPYVAYVDYGNGGKATVMKFDALSGNWTNVGAPGFSAGGVGYTSLVFNGDVPYTAYSDFDKNYKATVMKFDALSGNWVNVGTPGFSAAGVRDISLAFEDGAPYVAYTDSGNGEKATVMKFDALSGDWVNVGIPGFSAETAAWLSLAFDNNGAPYVAYVQSLGVVGSGKAAVMKFDALSGNWTDVGPTGGFSATSTYYTSLAFDNSDTPYVAYEDLATNGKATVMKFDALSGNWVNVGIPGFSAGQANDISLVFDGSHVLYVAYRDYGNSQKGSIMKFDILAGNWVNVGDPGFSAGVAYYTSLALDGSNVPYVAYMDDANGGRATVMNYFEYIPTVTATETLSATPTVTIIPTETMTATVTPTDIATLPSTATPTVVDTATPTITLTATPTLTSTLTPTRTSAVATVIFKSSGAQDGWVLAANPLNLVGGAMKNTGALRVGDDSLNRQYKAVLSFNTSSIPAGATIKSAVLKLHGGTTGSILKNYTPLFGSLLVDIRKGPFGMAALQVTDFQAAASAVKVGTFGVTANNLWYSAILNTGGRAKINRAGVTQFKVYFTKPTNANKLANIMNFNGGETATFAPVLVITYAVP